MSAFASGARILAGSRHDCRFRADGTAGGSPTEPTDRGAVRTIGCGCVCRLAPLTEARARNRRRSRHRSQNRRAANAGAVRVDAFGIEPYPICPWSKGRDCAGGLLLSPRWLGRRMPGRASSRKVVSARHAGGAAVLLLWGRRCWSAGARIKDADCDPPTGECATRTSSTQAPSPSASAARWPRLPLRVPRLFNPQSGHAGKKQLGEPHAMRHLQEHSRPGGTAYRPSAHSKSAGEPTPARQKQVPPWRSQRGY